METLHCSNSDPPKNNADGGWQEMGNLCLPTLWTLPGMLQDLFAALGDTRYSLGWKWFESPSRKIKWRKSSELARLKLVFSWSNDRYCATFKKPQNTTGDGRERNLWSISPNSSFSAPQTSPVQSFCTLFVCNCSFLLSRACFSPPSHKRERITPWLKPQTRMQAMAICLGHRRIKSNSNEQKQTTHLSPWNYLWRIQLLPEEHA